MAFVFGVFTVACAGSAGDGGTATQVSVNSAATVRDVPPETDSSPRSSTWCEPEELTMWASRAVVNQDAGVADVAIRIDSDSGQPCEIVLTEQPDLEQSARPELLLGPGGRAEIVVDVAPLDCADDPDALLSVPVLLNGFEREVVVNTIGSCGYELTSPTLLDSPSRACTATDLEATSIPNPRWLVIRNESKTSCQMSNLLKVTVDGASWPDHDSVFPSSPRLPVGQPIDVLSPGDVIGVQLSSDSSYGCDPTDEAQLVLDHGTEISLDYFETCSFLDPGPAGPYVSNPNAALADYGTSDFDIERALRLLEPFSTSIEPN